MPGLKVYFGPADDLPRNMLDEGLSLELTLDTDPRIVSITRRFVEQAMEKLVDDADAVFRVAMAAHELLENAAKYAENRQASLALRLEPNGDGGRQAVLTMTNQTSPDHIARLKQNFAEMNTREDPYDYYFELMRRNASDTTTSGLGLARIRAEGEMRLAFDAVGTQVLIRATAQIPERRAP
ncbi:MAG: hypothetical protein KA712_06930 [Myxococcales bacterium]|nr:hypothetical protein [Myxococcales bacterium]